jgi:prepilin-type N-terminal cleavage/methylation domain-containing protein
MKPKFNLQSGFTLVEVLTVMLVLVAIASITVESTKDFVFQGRYDVTKDRYEKIKKAIIGDPNQVINGQPNIEGFVKDVGRLPFALQELLDGHFCSDTRYFTQVDCTAASAIWAATSNWQGSYLATGKAFSDSDAITDGWSNTAVGNYGWEVSFKDRNGNATTTIANAVSMSIQSKGKNGCIHNGTTCTDSETFDIDYPNIASRASIEASDWMINIDGIQANVMASGINGSCTITAADPATCTAMAGTWVGSCTGMVTPTSKLGCESVSGTWTYGTPSNLCLKILQNGKVYKSEGTLPTISENGREQAIVFSSVFYDINANSSKDAGENMVVFGNASLSIYTDCTFTTKYNDTSPTRSDIQVTLYPNTTLPTMNW